MSIRAHFEKLPIIKLPLKGIFGILLVTPCLAIAGCQQNHRQGGLPYPSQTFAFTADSLEQWQHRVFKGESNYRVVSLKGKTVLEASTDGAASLLYRQQDISLQETPIVRWQWRIANTYSAKSGMKPLDEKSKTGDDYPARFYVAVQTGLLPWETLVINYVWSSSMPIGESWPNAFTDKATMLVLQSGSTRQQQWLTETRNLKDDFRQLFDLDVDTINGFAVMVDGDNSNQKGKAWFGDIQFLPE